MEIYVTFEVPVDRGPAAWAWYGNEQIQIGPYETEADAWSGLAATIGQERADLARIIRVEDARPAP